MTSLFQKLFAVSTLAIMLAAATGADATLIGPVWPAPGGVSFSASGAGAGSAGGKTFMYSGFNSGDYSNLYWGQWLGSSIGASLDGADISGPERMTFFSNDGNTATWLGSTNWYHSENGGASFFTETLQTRFTLTLSGNAAFENAASLDPALSSLGALAAVNGDFSANLLFQAFHNGSWVAVNDLYNSYHEAGVQTGSTFSGGFYYTEPAPAPAVPEPSTIVLLGAGLGSLALLRRRAMK